MAPRHITQSAQPIAERRRAVTHRASALRVKGTLDENRRHAEAGQDGSKKLHPEVGLEVVAFEPGRSLVLRGGVPMGNTPPPYDFTWAFVLREPLDGTTRLLVRERYAYTRRWAPLLVEPVALVSFVMSQKMLRGIRDRAEGDRRQLSTGS